MSRVINIDPLYECKTIEEAHAKLNEGIFSTLIAGIVGYIIGKKTGIKIAGREDNIKRFRQALKNINKSIDNDVLGRDKLKKMASKYRVKIIEK